MRIDTTRTSLERIRRLRQARVVAVLGLLVSFVFVGLPGSVQAQSNPWEAAEREETPTPSTTEVPEAETTPQPAPLREEVTPGIPEPPASTPAPGGGDRAGFSNWSGMELPIRIMLVVLLLVIGYCLPTIFYSSMLRNTRMGPGPAAGSCLAVGGLLTMWIIPWLFARIDYAAGVRVRWFEQWDNWAWAGGYLAVFVLLAVVAAVSRGGQR